MVLRDHSGTNQFDTQAAPLFENGGATTQLCWSIPVSCRLNLSRGFNGAFDELVFFTSFRF